MSQEAVLPDLLEIGYLARVVKYAVLSCRRLREWHSPSSVDGVAMPPEFAPHHEPIVKNSELK